MNHRLLLAERGFELAPPAVRHGLIAASLVAHVLVIAWLIRPPVERVDHVRQLYLLDIDLGLRQPCPHYVWIERPRGGCVIDLVRRCRPAIKPLDE